MVIYIDNDKYARKISVFSFGNNINTEKRGYGLTKTPQKNALRIFVKS